MAAAIVLTAFGGMMRSTKSGGGDVSAAADRPSGAIRRTLRRVFSPNTVLVLYSTPRRGTLSYVALLIYIGATTICWDRLALWPWLAMSAGAGIVLFILGTLWTAQDDRATQAPPLE